MKKIVSLFILFMVLTSVVLAEDYEAPPTEIKIEGTRLPIYFSEENYLPSNVLVFRQNELLDNLSDVLRVKEGITYSDDLGLGLGARIDLRGFGGEGKQALILFDGARAVEPFDNSIAWHLYPIEYLNQVVVQKGGVSTAFGEGAFSGVIQMRTKSPTKESKISFESEWGSFNTQKYFIEASGSNKDFGIYFGARYKDTEGYRQNAFHESGSFLLKTDWTQDLLWIENTLYFIDNETGIAGPLSFDEMKQDRRQKDPDGEYGDQFSDKLIQNSLKVVYHSDNIEISNQSIYKLRNQDSQQTFGGMWGGTSINDIETESLSNILQTSLIIGTNVLVGGVEFTKDDIYNPFEFINTPWPFGSERAIDRRMFGIFLQDDLILAEKINLSAGVRWDEIDWDIYDLKSPNAQKRKRAKAMSPSFGIEVNPVDKLSIFGNISKSFKAPDANTLIFETPNLFTPNSDIDPQTAIHHEVGLRYTDAFKISFFYIETEKEILFNDISNLNENFNTTRQGLEYSGEWELSDGINLISNYTYTQAEFDESEFSKNEIPMTPKHKWSVGVLTKITNEIKAQINATGVSGLYALNDFNNIFPVEDYWTLDSKISYKKDNWEIYLICQNFFGEEYSSFTASNGVDEIKYNPMPEQVIKAGLKIEL